MHEKHKGHESMHAEMVIILLLTLVVAQVILVEWKKRHYRSYSVCLRPFDSWLSIFYEIFYYKYFLSFRISLTFVPILLTVHHPNVAVDHTNRNMH